VSDPEILDRVERLEAWVAHLAPESADLGAMPPTSVSDGDDLVTITIPRHIAELAAEGVVGSNVPEDDVSTFVRRACQAVVS
jgi:hypothetical protein